MTCKIAAMVCKIFPFADYFCNGIIPYTFATAI